jgi:hypothetical protein
MNHASGAVAPPGTEVIEVGDAIWQRAQRRGLVQGAVRLVRVVKVLVLAQHGHQVALVPDQGVGAGNPVTLCGLGNTRGPVRRAGLAGESARWRLEQLAHQQVAGLLGHPLTGWGGR